MRDKTNHVFALGENTVALRVADVAESLVQDLFEKTRLCVAEPVVERQNVLVMLLACDRKSTIQHR